MTLTVYLIEPGDDRYMRIEGSQLVTMLNHSQWLEVPWYDNDRNYMGDLLYQRVWNIEVMTPETDGQPIPVYRFHTVRPNAAYARFIGLEQQ